MASEEKALIRRLLVGEEAAFRELVGQLEKPLLAFIQRFTPDVAEDIFQETFVRVIRKLAEFKPDVSLKTWIFTIARNLCLDHIKMHKRHGEVSLDRQADEEEGKVITFKEVLQSAAREPGETAELSDDQRRVLEALRTLEPARREALILRTYCDMPYEEIAQIMRAPVGTCKYRVHEALNELAAKLGGARGAAAG